MDVNPEVRLSFELFFFERLLSKHNHQVLASKSRTRFRNKFCFSFALAPDLRDANDFRSEPLRSRPALPMTAFFWAVSLSAARTRCVRAGGGSRGVWGAVAKPGPLHWERIGLSARCGSTG